jgi:hypothetical protein
VDPWLKKNSRSNLILRVDAVSDHRENTELQCSKGVFQRYRNFITKIISAKLVVMALAMMMGQATIKMP